MNLPTHAQPAAPAYHIRPRRGWLNDPNGVIHHAGRWHVFFQHNPAAAVHHRIHWGHVSSPDLADWTEHPVAFGPQPGGPDQNGCWSGVAAYDGERPVMLYSGIGGPTEESTVCLRRLSADDDGSLDLWSDPLVVAVTPVADGVRVMRDPFLFSYAGRRWAVLGGALEGGTPALLLFGCDDLERWTYEGVFARDVVPFAQHIEVADVWECPQLLEVDGRWVLLLSAQFERRLGAVIAVVGDLVEELGTGRPRFVPANAQLLDTGTDCYAPQAVAAQPGPDGAAGEPLFFGWVRQEGVEGAGDTVVGEGAGDTKDTGFGGNDLVAGCLTLPRRLRVIGGAGTLAGAVADDTARATHGGAAGGASDRDDKDVVTVIPDPSCELLVERGIVTAIDGDRHADRVCEGDSEGVGDGVGDGVAVGDGVGESDGDSDSEGEGEGDGEGVARGATPLALTSEQGQGLPRACRVRLDEPGPTTFTGTGGDIEVHGPATVWIDGEVLEAYPDGAVAATYRHVGTLAWVLRRR